MFWAYKEDATENWLKARSPIYMEDWLDRLAVMGVITEKDYHIEVGKIYGIPKCCREWFVYLTCYIGWQDALVATDMIYGDDCLQDLFDYVRCPKCRKGDLNE